MNQYRHSILASALAFIATLSLPAFAADTVTRDSDALISLTSNLVVSAGMSPETVEYQLGQPTEKITADLWVYADFRAANRPAGSRADTLLVVFKDEAVSFVRLTEWAHVQVALARIRTAGSPSVAAK